MQYRKAAAVLCTIMLLCQLALAQAPVFPGEPVSDADIALKDYTYTTASALAKVIADAGNPGSIDIRPAKVPIEDLIALKSLLPGTIIVCNTELCGKEMSTLRRAIDLSGTSLPDMEELETALACFERLETLSLHNAKNLTNEQADALRKALPDVEVNWTVNFGHWSLPTDALAFSTLNSNKSQRYDSKEYSVLRYCTKLRALDLGHNVITDISFLTAMPDLKILILADNEIHDITPLAECGKLEYIELFMNNITDFSPLAGLSRLLDLNLCHNKAVECGCLASLTQLERLWLSYNREMPKKETEALQQALPNCLCNFEIFYSTHANWRKHPRYAVVKYIFEHDEYLEWDTPVPTVKEQEQGKRRPQ